MEENVKEEIFEASLSPEIRDKISELSATVRGESKAAVSFYDPLDETFEGKKKRLKTEVFRNERIVFGSDCGHIANPHPIDSLRMLILSFLQSGVADEHVRMMCRTNAYNLLH
jgi:hypothetical protein